MKKQINFLLLLLLISVSAISQRSIKIILQDIETKVEKNESSSDLRKELLQQITDESSSSFFIAIDGYPSNANVNIRREINSIVNQYGKSTQTIEQKQKAIQYLSNGLDDSESSIVTQVVRYFNFYPSAAFSSAVKQKIETIIRNQGVGSNDLIKLSGVLNMTTLIDFYFDRVENKKIKAPKTEWNTRLALARMGNGQMQEYIYTKISSAPICNEVVENFYPDLLYIRYQPGILFLFDQISNEEKLCRTANPEKQEPIVCAYSIIQLLAPVIKDFPCQLNQYGELESDNYEQLWLDVKKWITEHRTRYEMVE